MKCTSLSPDDKKYVEGIFQVDPKVGELPCHKAGDDSGSEASSLPLDDDTARADDPKNLQKTKQYGRRRVRDIENQQESVKSR
ncbi:hypothetical protein H4219_000952 [Mycoemilia scoparia]|uniref:Uncharacterized protein n=1 Tax=Mycoemilia scoparia TaxID=417184 RepID=A0A9W8A1Q8_9FUNG|nr:hypothetical protein H4219_000952 [Mycoemilia scoparia]